MSAPSLVWFRDDLRLADNPALTPPLERGPVIGLLRARRGVARHPPARRRRASGGCTAASQSLGERLAERGSTLVLRRGAAASVVADVAEEASAGAVFWNRRYGGAEREVDAALKTALRDDGLDGRVVRRLAAVRAVDRADRSRARRTRCSRRSGGRARRCRRRARRCPSRARSRGRARRRERRPRRLGAAADRARTGPAACARRGSRASRRRARGCASSSPTTSPTTTARATSRRRARPRGSRRACAGASSARTRCGTQTVESGQKSRAGSSPSSAGASSPRTCCTTTPTSRRRTCGRSSTRSRGRACTRRSCGRGSRGAPASRSWMPACASCGTPA